MSATVDRAPRGQFDGVLQIVRYNWTLYLVALFAFGWRIFQNVAVIRRHFL